MSLFMALWDLEWPPHGQRRREQKEEKVQSGMSPMLNLLKTHKVQRMLVDFSSVLFINTYHKLVSGYNQTEQMFYYQSPSTFRCVIFPSCFIHFFHNCSLLSRVSSPPPCIILHLCVCARLIVNLRRPPLSERVK